MAKVGTAYVNIRPDLSGFRGALKTALAEVQATLKVKLVPDSTGFAAALKNITLDGTVKSAVKQVGKETGEDLSKAMGQAIEMDKAFNAKAAKAKAAEYQKMLAQAWADNKVFDAAIERKGKDWAAALKENDAFDERLAKRQVNDWNKVLAEAFADNKEFDRAIEEKGKVWAAALKENDAFDARAAKQKVQDWNAVLTQAFKENKDFDRAIKDKEKELSLALRMNTAFDANAAKAKVREYNQAWTIALRLNREKDSQLASDAREAAADAANSVFGQFMSALSAVSGGWTKLITNQIGAVLSGGLVASIGSIVTGWISVILTALAGVAVIGLGAYFVRQDPEVRKAATRLGKTFTESFTTSTKMAAPAFKDALDILTGAIPGWSQQFGKMLQGLAPQILTLAQGIRGFVTELLGGLGRGMPAIKATLDSMSVFLPRVGKAIGDFFTKMDPKEAASAMEGMLVTAENLLHTLGSLAATSLVWGNNIRTGARNFKSFADAVKGFVFLPQAMGEAISNIGKSDQSENLELNRWKKFWNEFSGHSDAAADKVKASNARIRESMNQIAMDASRRFPLVGIDSIETVVQGLVNQMGVAAIGSEVFAAKLNNALGKIQVSITATEWQKFGKDAATGFISMGKAVDDTRDAIDDLIDSMDILDNRFIDVEEATTKFYDVQDRITEKMNDPDGLIKSFSAFTVAGRENRGMIIDEARALENLMKAQLHNGATVQDVMALYREYTPQIIKNAQSLGANAQEAEEFTAKLGLIPQRVLTEMAVAGVPGALEELQKIPGSKTVMVDADVNVNKFAEVAGYIASQFEANGKYVGKTFAEYVTGKAMDTFIANQGKYVGVGAAVVMEIQEGAKEVGPAGAYDMGTRFQEQVNAAHELHRENYRLTGKTTAGWIIGGATDTVDTDAGGVGKSMVDGVSQGVTDSTSTATTAGEKIGTAAYLGALSVNMKAAGESLASQLADGLRAGKEVVEGAAGFLAGLVDGFFKHNSPVKYGPLSGAGDLGLAGQNLAKALADGMLKGESDVASAAATLAGAAAIKPSYYGLTGMNGASAIPATMNKTYVYIGNEQLDAYIINTVDEDNEALARAMLAGRSGVG